ncbi:hypothetical protein ULMA_22060 [Patiriisocius marinus]|uniref:Uncharacterized protein n=2 Tax=Flavobacteriales TaxID=200644 RepID=A0A5J4J265_9FLAO|nr:hypothetical protein [Patiriisocius marinus]GER60098.1 hypothetical protein ULMA_22060 [Patiriisocius marinus]
MTRIRAKEIEQLQIERFISNVKHGIIFQTLEASETPDFTAETTDKIISIEHTRFINNQSKMIEVYRQSIIDAARLKFEDKYDVELQCMFRYSDAVMDKRHSKNHYIDLFFSLVETIYLANKGRDFRVSTKHCKLENEFVDSINVSSDTTWSNWQSVGAYLVKPIDYKDVQLVINHKASLITQYPNNIDEKWLVIIAGLGHRSSGYRFDLLDRSSIDKNGFDRIYFFDDRSEDTIEIV